MEKGLISMPNPDSAGIWTEKYKSKIAMAEQNLVKVDSVLQKISESKKLAVRNTYTLDVYEQVAKSVQFSNRALITLTQLDHPSGEERNKAKAKLAGMEEEWKSIQADLEAVYGKTRSLNKPADYILDQDHHRHLANQAVKFTDWQFYVEDLFLKKIKE